MSVFGVFGLAYCLPFRTNFVNRQKNSRRPLLNNTLSSSNRPSITRPPSLSSLYSPSSSPPSSPSQESTVVGGLGTEPSTTSSSSSQSEVRTSYSVSTSTSTTTTSEATEVFFPSIAAPPSDDSAKQVSIVTQLLSENFTTDIYWHIIEYVVGELRGCYLYRTGSLGADHGQFRFPTGLTIDDSNHLYVCDPGNYRICVYNISTTCSFERTIELKHTHDFIPYSISYSDSELFISDHINKRVQVIETPTFTQKSTFELKFNPTGIAAGPEVCYVGNSEDRRVLVYSKQGEVLRGRSTDPGFTCSGEPEGMCIDDNEIYVADKIANNVQVLDLDGKTLRIIGADKETGLYKPVCVAVSDIHLYVGDSAGLVLVFDKKNGEFVQRIGKGRGTGDGQIGGAVGGIAVRDGKIFVADTENHRIQVWK